MVEVSDDEFLPPVTTNAAVVAALQKIISAKASGGSLIPFEDYVYPGRKLEPFVELAPESIFKLRQHTALFDESTAGPFMVGAAILSNSFVPVENEINNLHQDLTERFYYLDGHSNFDRFKIHGFHASSDPREVQFRFTELLARLTPIKIFILLTDGTRRPDLGPQATTVVLYRELVRTVFLASRASQRVRLIFEQNDALDKSFLKIAQSAERGIRAHFDVELYTGHKAKPHSLSIIDYAMHTFRRWYVAGMPIDDRKSEFTQWRAIRSSVAVVRSFETGVVVKRGLAL